MKKIIILLATISIVGFTYSCKKENTEAVTTTKIGATQNNSYSLNNKPLRKYDDKKGYCINLVENCASEDVVIRPHYDAAILVAINNHTLIDFFNSTENCDVFLPEGSLGVDLKTGLTSGIYGVFRKSSDSKTFYFIGDISKVNVDNFVFVTSAIVQ